jgi:hypothetical protein
MSMGCSQVTILKVLQLLPRVILILLGSEGEDLSQNPEDDGRHEIEPELPFVIF